MLSEHSFAARVQQHGNHRRDEARAWQETPAQQSRGSGSKGPRSTMTVTMQTELWTPLARRSSRSIAPVKHARARHDSSTENLNQAQRLFLASGDT